MELPELRRELRKLGEASSHRVGDGDFDGDFEPDFDFLLCQDWPEPDIQLAPVVA